MRKGYNRSGTQRCLCGVCAKTYTINPKQRAYSEETQKLAPEDVLLRGKRSRRRQSVGHE